MANRREFVTWGVLAIGAVAAARRESAAFAQGTAPPQAAGAALADPLYAIVYDERFPESAGFAAQARSLGQRTQNLDRGDVTSLWYDDLYHRWKKGPAAIAGLTAPGALFVLETFGNDAGLRLQFKADHRIQGNQVEHRLFGPSPMLRAALPLETNGNHWSAHMSRVMCGVRCTSFERTEARLMTQASGGLPGEHNYLVSWVLAPRSPGFITGGA